MFRFFTQWKKGRPASRDKNIETLPNDLLQYQLSFLSIKDAGAFLHSSSALHRAGKQDLQLAILLEAVAHGNQDTAEQIIKHDTSLLLRKGSVTDYSGRQFNDITPLQYALWALDSAMWRMISRYLPAENVREQFAEHQAHGTAHGHHYDFKPLLSAMQKYTRHFFSWDSEQCGAYWCYTIGALQQSLPAHVAQTYCRPSASDAKTVTEATKRSLYFISYRAQHMARVHFYEAGLGKDFGIVRTFRLPMLAKGRAYTMLDCVTQDLRDLTQLANTKLYDLEQLGNKPSIPPRPCD